MGKSIEKISSDVSSLNGAIRELNGRVDQILTDQSYGLTDSSLAEGVDLSVISLQENIRGTIEQGSVVILAYPDGSNPLLIENTYGNQPATGYEDDFIVKLGGVGTTISPTVDYPTGSIIYQANYSTVGGGTTSPAGDGTGANLKPVQYNDNGNFAADQGFYYNPNGDTLYANNIIATNSGSGNDSIFSMANIGALGDIEATGNIQGTNLTSTGTVTLSGLTAINQTDVVSIDTSTGQLYTQTPQAAGASYNLQFKDHATGGFAGASLVDYVPAATPYLNIASELRVDAPLGTTTIKFTNLPTTAQTNVIGIDGSGQLYEQPTETSGGPNYSVQFNDSLGGFDGESSFTYSPTNNTLSCANIDSSFSGSYGDIKGKLKGDNIGTGIYATGSAKYWYLTPYDFLGATSGSGVLTSAGNYMMMPSASAFYMVSIQIPVGYKLVKIFIKGNIANSFSVQSSSWSSIFGGSFGSGTVNTELTLSTPVNSTEGNYITLSINPSGSYNRIYGARLTLEEI